MAKRTESSLYPKAAEVADQLAAKLGNQKPVLSAGVVLLGKLEAPDREVACAEGKGLSGQWLDVYAERRALFEIRKWIEEARLQAALAGVLEARTIYADLAQIVERGLTSRIQRGDALGPMRQTIEAIQRIVIPTDDEVQEIRRLRELLGPSDEEVARQAAEGALPPATKQRRKKTGSG